MATRPLPCTRTPVIVYWHVWPLQWSWAALFFFCEIFRSGCNFNHLFWIKDFADFLLSHWIIIGIPQQICPLSMWIFSTVWGWDFLKSSSDCCYCNTLHIVHSLSIHCVLTPHTYTSIEKNSYAIIMFCMWEPVPIISQANSSPCLFATEHSQW